MESGKFCQGPCHVPVGDKLLIMVDISECARVFRVLVGEDQKEPIPNLQEEVALTVCDIHVKYRAPGSRFFFSHGFFHKLPLFSSNSLSRLEPGEYNLELSDCQPIEYRPSPSSLRFLVTASKQDSLEIGSVRLLKQSWMRQLINANAPAISQSFSYVILISVLVVVFRYVRQVIASRRTKKDGQISADDHESTSVKTSPSASPVDPKNIRLSDKEIPMTEGKEDDDNDVKKEASLSTSIHTSISKQLVSEEHEDISILMSSNHEKEFSSMTTKEETPTTTITVDVVDPSKDGKVQGDHFSPLMDVHQAVEKQDNDGLGERNRAAQILTVSSRPPSSLAAPAAAASSPSFQSPEPLTIDISEDHGISSTASGSNNSGTSNDGIPSGLAQTSCFLRTTSSSSPPLITPERCSSSTLMRPHLQPTPMRSPSGSPSWGVVAAADEHQGSKATKWIEDYWMGAQDEEEAESFQEGQQPVLALEDERTEKEKMQSKQEEEEEEEIAEVSLSGLASGEVDPKSYPLGGEESDDHPDMGVIGGGGGGKIANEETSREEGRQEEDAACLHSELGLETSMDHDESPSSISQAENEQQASSSIQKQHNDAAGGKRRKKKKKRKP